MAAGYCYCLGINSNAFFLNDYKKAFILGLNVPKVTAYNEFADTIIRCILYAFVMRYWKFLPENSKDIVRLRVEEEFSTTDILKDFI